MIDADVSRDKFSTICSKVDPEHFDKELVVLRSSDGEIFVGFCTERMDDKIISIEDFADVEESSEYSNYLKVHCSYCQSPNVEVPDNIDNPNLSSCRICHDRIKSQLEDMIEDNCPEVMANHL